MELLPCDCLRIICYDIDDKDFINLISSSKHLYSHRIYKLKILINKYNLSEILCFNNIFVFSNIVYDLINFEPSIIPQTVIEITFLYDCNEKVNELCNFKHLTKINVGMYFCNHELFSDNISHMIDKKELAMTLITNRVFASLFNCGTNQLYNNNTKWFILNFKRMYDSNYVKYKDLKNVLENFKTINQLNFSFVNTINSCINKSNYKELRYYKKNYVEIVNDIDEYMAFLVFHVDKILKYLIQFKKSLCEKHEKINCDFSESVAYNLFELRDVKKMLLI
jgi:hypothetical protein